MKRRWVMGLLLAGYSTMALAEVEPKPVPVESAVQRASVTKSKNILDPKVVAKNREAYVEKQRALEKRRQERDQRLRDQSKGVPALPLPP